MVFSEFKEHYQKVPVEHYPESVHQEPLVSVIIVTFQHANYIRQCLDSVLMQKTDFVYEIVLGEDASTDGTREICIDYAMRYPDKIRLFLHQRANNISINGKATGRFNFTYCLYSARGKYISLCEGDDYWTDPFKLQKQVDILENKRDVDLVFCRAKVLKNGELSDHVIPVNVENSSLYIDLLEEYNYITTTSAVFRSKELSDIKKWFMEAAYGDLALYKLVINNGEIKCLNEFMVVYRVHRGGLFSGEDKIRTNKKHIQFYKNIYPHLSRDEQSAVKSKVSLLQVKISNLKYPESKVLRKLHYLWLKGSYQILKS